ncbi:MAG: hypothetical protein CVV05_00435 [Gammaproteobacteria bacterium HGW-Gammaproteobacteria-1]|jgi:hypothetical protein|nr:MAG: hypothetical protein CVV05_00435 [Gammaproteobacteria bacterium HGW-Gammaproteobacteria-1]
MLNHIYDELHPSEIPLTLDSQDVTMALADFYDTDAFGEDPEDIFGAVADHADINEGTDQALTGPFHT